MTFAKLLQPFSVKLFGLSFSKEKAEEEEGVVNVQVRWTSLDLACESCF